MPTQNEFIKHKERVKKMSLNLERVVGTATIGTKLSYCDTEEGDYVDIPGLQEVPELGGDPEQIEVTTLADSVKRSIPGVRDLGDLAFNFLYNKTNFLALSKLTGVGYWKVEFPDGLVASFSAIPNVKMSGASNNAALTYTIGMSLQSEIKFK